jgi:hypothetical protein
MVLHQFTCGNEILSVIILWFFDKVLRFSLAKILYRVSQKEKPIYWEVIVISHSKRENVNVRVLFRKVSQIELFHCTVSKLMNRKRYSVLFLIPVFIVQMTKLVQFTWHNTFLKIPLSTSMHFATRVRTWRVAWVYSVLYSEIALSRKPFRIKRCVHIHFSA